MYGKSVVTDSDSLSLRRSALRAWCQLRPDDIYPACVDVISAKRRSTVCRLRGAGPGGSSVIAKRLSNREAEAEQTIYEQLLASLPIPTVRSYGFIDEKSSRSCWLFMEDAGSRKYRTDNEQHRTLIAEWLGIVHTRASSQDLRRVLPELDLGEYLRRVRSTLFTIENCLYDPEVSPQEIAVLKRIVSRCRLIESNWNQVRDICDQIPDTLVHRDLDSDNMRVTRSCSELRLLVFDWGRAVWGSPAIDLAQSVNPASSGYAASPHLEAYWNTVSTTWPAMSLSVIEKIADVGSLLWYIDGLHSLTDNLSSAWMHKVMRHMRVYESAITAAAANLGWINQLRN